MASHDGASGIRIRLRKNGPYVIEGGAVEVVAPDGQVLRIDRQPVALCRCGASLRKPFCDGSHARVGFDDDGAAAPASVPPLPGPDAS